MRFIISPKKVSIWLLIIVGLLNSIGFIGRIVEYLLGYEETTDFVRLFHVVEEGNITAWFSSLLLLLSAILLALIATIKKSHDESYVWHWRVLSLIFFYISLDEAARIHELTIEPLRSMFNLSGIFFYGWVIIAIPLLILLGVFYLSFLRDLPKETRWLFILAGSLFVIGALGMEMFSGYILSSSSKLEIRHTINPVLITIEELLENIGIVVFIYSLLTYIKAHSGENEVILDFT